MKSFLQTTEWLKFQEAVGHKTWRFSDGKITANIVKYNLPFGKSYLYVPHGPEINFDKIQSGLKNEVAGFIKYLKDLAKSENAIFVKIEPLSDVVMELLYSKGMRRSNKQIQPYKTVILDLNLSEEHLLGKMHTKTRYNIKVAERHNIQVEAGGSIDDFWKLLKKTTKRDRFSPHPEEYYKKLLDYFGNNGEIKTDVFIAYNNSKPVSGAIILQYGNVGYYLHGASDHDHRSFMAPYALHWEIIRKLKAQGLKFYDFWGIDSQKWPGVTRFKLGWGGEQKEHPGSFDLVASNIWYFVYNLARKVI